MLSLGPSRTPPPGELPGHDPSFPSVTYGVPMCRFPFLLNQSAGSGACPGWMFSALHALGSAALGALLLSGCLGAPRVVSDWAGIELLEDGDVWTGRGYTVRTENVAALSADPGTVTPGKDPGTFVYHYPREKLADHSAVFPLAVDFSYETPEGKRFQRRLRLAEQDPLLHYQWHLYNNGTDFFGTASPPRKGLDLNIVPAWGAVTSKGEPITGRGVLVAVLDLPVDLEHEDLTSRIFPVPAEPGLDKVNQGIVLDNVNKTRGGELHGTSVASLIAADGFNGRGIRGIAWESRIYSVNAVPLPYEKAPRNGGEMLLEALRAVLRIPETGVVNASIGPTLVAENDGSGELIRELARCRIPVIHAAGNEYQLTSWERDEINRRCRKAGTDCMSSVTGALSRSPLVVNVAAVNASGEKSSSSSTSPNMWVAAFGGEDGHTLRGGGSPGIVAALSSYSCDRNAYDRDGDRSLWRSRGDQSCHYTARMKGTSAAAAEITGIVALLKQISPAFTVSQIRYLLAAGARNDLAIPSLAYDPIYHPEKHFVIDPGWQSNAAGIRHSPRFGFGLADAGATVRAALACGSDPACRIREEAPEKLEARVSSCHPLEQGCECSFGPLQPGGAGGGGADSSGGGGAEPPGAGEVLETESAELIFGRILPDHMAGSFRGFRELALHVLPFYTELQAELYSPSGNMSVIKPSLASWLPAPFLGSYDQSRRIGMGSGIFYRERLAGSGVWKLHLRGASCPGPEAGEEDYPVLRVEAYRIRK